MTRPMLDLGAKVSVDARAAFSDATPFGHLVIDDLLAPVDLARIADAFDDEPAEPLQDEIMDVLAGPSPPDAPALRAFFDALTSPASLAAVTALTGEHVTGAELRAYAYQPGSYLLPHADRDAEGRRALAFVFYVGHRDALSGGELDLYALDEGPDGRVTTRVARTIEPRPNRCVLFEVHGRALHRVREVTSGVRLSLAGWLTRSLYGAHTTP